LQKNKPHIIFTTFLCLLTFTTLFSQQKKIDSTNKLNTIFLNEVVVTGTKTFKRKTESPVIVNILDSRTLNNLQVCNLSEGLKFQPGLRIETDCQTCNYTQLRINGLQGGYSQILINGRPIFSPLMGLYGMEQLPVNMIERIEVVRGGGSSLYGSSAVGGTVNVITKIPNKNGFEINSFYQNINAQSNDFNVSANATLVNETKTKGTTIFFNSRNRDYYDANADNFSELPKLYNKAIGINSFFKWSENEKLEVSLSYLNEYRTGGEMVNKPAYLTQQSEERTHHIIMGSADYQINFNANQSSLIAYSAFQKTNRDHYTGILPDEAIAVQNHLQNPPYGNSNNATFQVGLQYNQELKNLFGSRNVLTIGSEFISDKVYDAIPAYNYLVNQQTKNWGIFFQNDWDISSKLNLLSGVRIDEHNFLNKLILNPRLAVLYKPQKNTQMRLSYGTGFRAPQAFDTDLHIAFAGGGVSRVRLQNNLRAEKSNSFSASINFDKANKKIIYGYTLETFYTQLNNAFVLENIGNDNFGEIFEKRNGQSAFVYGSTIELRVNYNRKIQVELGYTLQQSKFSNPIEYIKDLKATNRFLRTPNSYGFSNITINPNKKISINLNYIYTGSMLIAHFGGAENFLNDAMITTSPFSEVNTKIAYQLQLKNKKTNIELYGGIKNVLNNYQSDFDKGKNRDSNYVYGPAMPQSFFIGFKVSNNY
jgi:outer membrane receptor for ferrienterochelin and colicins